MIWRFSVTAFSQFPSNAALRASSPNWRRVCCFCAKDLFLPTTSDCKRYSSRRRRYFTYQKPRACARHHDVNELPGEFTVVLEVQQRVASCAPGPPALRASFDQYFIGLTESLRADFGLDALLQLLQLAMTPVLFGGRHIVLPAGRKRARTWRVHSEVDLVATCSFQQFQRLQELCFRFPGKPDDDIGGDRCLGHALSRELNSIEPIVACIRSPHAAQDVIVSGLDREIHVLAN